MSIIKSMCNSQSLYYMREEVKGTCLRSQRPCCSYYAGHGPSSNNGFTQGLDGKTMKHCSGERARRKARHIPSLGASTALRIRALWVRFEGVVKTKRYTTDLIKCRGN